MSASGEAIELVVPDEPVNRHVIVRRERKEPHGRVRCEEIHIYFGLARATVEVDDECAEVE